MSIDIGSYGPLNANHVKRINETIHKALNEHPRTMVLRVDLRFPDNFQDDSTVITRFIVSLKAQVEADMQRRANSGHRVHLCKIRYIWARESNEFEKKHYHVALFFNKDTYAYPGSYYTTTGEYIHNLSIMAMEAWVRALNLNECNNNQQFYPLVHFPVKCCYHVNAKKGLTDPAYKEAINSVLYLAKLYSKVSSDGYRNFGCSQY
ncbi:TPA: inovirus Gp2 family protein [Yersinia enterocolitica]